MARDWFDPHDMRHLFQLHAIRRLVYLRFLLPAIVLMHVLAGTVALIPILQYVVSGLSRTVIAVVVGSRRLSLSFACARRTTVRRLLCKVSRTALSGARGIVVRDRLPPGAVGAVGVGQRSRAIPRDARKRSRGRGLDPAWLDRGPGVARAAGSPAVHPRRVMGRAGFRSRFADHSDIGKLDWPPKLEIDRVVRIYDPQDCARYHRGERVDTQFLWPLRDQ